MDMSGMDMGTSSFQPTNIKLAKAYWYAIAAVVAVLLVAQIVHTLQSRHRLRSCRTQSVQFPTKPTNAIQQSWATATAVAREMSYPQLYVPFKGLSWLTPPPLGRVLILLAYWSLIVGLMINGAILKDAYFWERIGFRNAWVTITQLPLLYMLASKSNIIAWLTGSSYERLNWLHRWVARTMFVTACMHGWHFWTEWVRADFVELELEMMPMVKYGLGAWGILLWMVITSIVPLRRLAYEFFVVQHIVGAIVFLYVTYVHIPAVARPYFWWAVAALCFDRAVRVGVLFWQNIRFTTNRSPCRGMQRVGHQAQVQAVGDSITVITIKDVHFSWRAGQHVYLWMPKVGPVEAHPFTIASAHQVADERCCNSIQLVVRAHTGFSKRLHHYAVQQEDSARDGKVTVLVSGPYGAPPRWGMFETLVLISASTGASFTLPILESVLQEKQTVCTKRIDFVLTARQDGDIGFYMQRLYEGVEKAKKTGIELRIHVCVTGGGSTPRGNPPEAPGYYGGKLVEMTEGSTTGCDSITANRISAEGDKDKRGANIDVEKTLAISTSTPLALLQAASREPGLQRSTRRPDIEAIIREPVEAAGGETSVIVCGGRSLTSTVRNCVSRLSDERAVHKGTGAQGIHLHVEEYSF